LVREFAGGTGPARFGRLQVLVTDALSAAPAQVQGVCVPESFDQAWPEPLFIGRAAVVAFEPRREYGGREATLFVPNPNDIAALCRWLFSAGVRHLVLVMPHAQAELPTGLRGALANLDEQAVASMGFEHVFFLRSAQAPRQQAAGHAGERLAQAMLSILRYMVPERERPVRAQAVAELAAVCMEWALGSKQGCVRVASPEEVWWIASAPANSQTDTLKQRALRWLEGESEA
jgi:hypothetical protein